KRRRRIGCQCRNRTRERPHGRRTTPTRRGRDGNEGGVEGNAFSKGYVGGRSRAIVLHHHRVGDVVPGEHRVGSSGVGDGQISFGGRAHGNLHGRSIVRKIRIAGAGGVELILPVAFAAGVMQVQPAGNARDWNVVFAGTASLNTAFNASRGP